MTKSVTAYIDETIRSHRTKDYELSIKNLPIIDQINILDFLFLRDKDTRELILERMQDLIEYRLPFVETEDKYEAGLKPRHDSQTGEVIWL